MLTPRLAAQVLSISPETCTVSAAGTIVPWLAAEGPYAYTPEIPPPTDEDFDYGKVMPEAFTRPGKYPFGFDAFGDRARAMDFWHQARDRGTRVKRLAVVQGERTEKGFSAPIALYGFRFLERAEEYVLIQNGSFRFLEPRQHPEVANGKIRVHRGIGSERILTHRCFTSHSDASECGGSARNRYAYLDYVTETFVSSALAFTFAHMGTRRAETEHVRSAVMLAPFFRSVPDLSPERRHGLLWPLLGFSGVHFSMSESIARSKFGPHYVTFETPLTNIRISSEVDGDELEIRLIDPDLISVIALHGCRLVFQPLV